MKEQIQINLHNEARERAEAIKQNNPRLWNEIFEMYFSKDALRRELAHHKRRCEIAEAKIAVLQEQIQLTKLKSETSLLESKQRKLKQHPIQQKPTVRLLSDDDVRAAYDRMRR